MDSTEAVDPFLVNLADFFLLANLLFLLSRQLSLLAIWHSAVVSVSLTIRRDNIFLSFSSRMSMQKPQMIKLRQL